MAASVEYVHHQGERNWVSMRLQPKHESNQLLAIIFALLGMDIVRSVIEFLMLELGKYKVCILIQYS
jgi:hypothetical protein